MATKPPIMNLFVNLESEFQNVQKSLTDIDENIKKITGKDPRVFQEKNNRSGNRIIRKSLAGNKRSRFYQNDHYQNESLDPNEEENFYNSASSKRSLQSQVVATSWETKQRDQVLEEQKNDKKNMSRSKRMFGMILGTLEKFKNEESQRKDWQKRAEIEKKLDQAAEEEREALKRERETLFKERKAKRLQMKCLEQKMNRAEIHKEWEQSQQFVGNYIETKTKPNIFYMPVKHNNETLKRQQETRDKYRIIFAEKRAKVQKELNEIDDLYKKMNDDDHDDHEDGDDVNEHRHSKLQHQDSKDHSVTMIHQTSNQHINTASSNNSKHSSSVENSKNSEQKQNAENDNPRKQDPESINKNNKSKKIKSTVDDQHFEQRTTIKDDDRGNHQESKTKNDLTADKGEDFEPIYD